MSRRGLLSVSIVWVAVVLALSASNGNLLAAPKGAKAGGVFVMASADDAQHLNPFNPDVRVDKVLQENIFEGLLKVDHTFKVQPGLARQYQTSPDGLRWTFSLRPGVKFHDGTTLTAGDVKYTFDWARDPKRGAATASLFAEVDRVEVVNPSTVRVVLKQPFAPFLRRVATHGIVPAGYHSRVGPDRFNKNPVGTGPYRFKEWKPGQHLILERFAGYWGGRAFIEQIKMRPIPEDSVRAIALRTGEVHTSVWPLTPGDTLDLLKNPAVAGYRAAGLQLSHIQMNNASPFFQDKRVRQAMMYALDREAMVRDIMRGLATIATGNLSPALPEYEPNVTQYKRDVDKAKKLLSDAGWSPGSDGILTNAQAKKFEITLLLIQGDEIRGPQAELAVANLLNVGISLKLERLEVGTFVNRVFATGTYELAFYNWPYGGANGDPDAYAQLACKASDNKSGWCNAKATELLQRGRTTVDPARRRTLYSELQKLFAEEVPFLYVMFWDDLVFVSKKLDGLPPPGEVKHTLALLWDMEKFWFKSQ